MAAIFVYILGKHNGCYLMNAWTDFHSDFFVWKLWAMWTHVVHYLGMGVHDPCTMNYMEVYGDSLAYESTKVLLNGSRWVKRRHFACMHIFYMCQSYFKLCVSWQLGYIFTKCVLVMDWLVSRPTHCCAGQTNCGQFTKLQCLFEEARLIYLLANL